MNWVKKKANSAAFSETSQTYLDKKFMGRVALNITQNTFDAEHLTLYTAKFRLKTVDRTLNTAHKAIQNTFY